MESALTSKGQATIPKPVRDHLNLAPGDKVKFFIQPDGTVIILPKLPASALRGMFRSRRDHPPSIEEMDAAIAKGATSRYKRFLRQK
jgi:antitoxin PrlF